MALLWEYCRPCYMNSMSPVMGTLLVSLWKHYDPPFEDIVGQLGDNCWPCYETIVGHVMRIL